VVAATQGACATGDTHNAALRSTGGRGHRAARCRGV